MIVAAPNPNLEQEGESQRIISPFAQTTSTVQTARKGGSGSWPLWIVSILLVLVILGISGYFVYNYLADPYRTMKSFPMDTYLTDYRSLSGVRFKADLKVAADLGYEEATGRLMVFTVADDNRSLVVLIPTKFKDIYFTKGQSYQVSLEVGEGGLVYAESCEKE